MRSPINADSHQIEALGAAMLALQPIAALLLEIGVSYHEFARLTRRAYVDEAAAKQQAIGARVSISRIAAATGMSRPEVSQVLSGDPIPIGTSDLTPRPTDRVLAAWTNDPDYLERDGKPKTLSYGDSSPNFSDLVKKHGPDIPPRAMLNELLASKLVSEISLDRFTPSSPSSAPRPPQKEAIRNFGAKINTLGYTLLRNLRSLEKKPLFETMTLTSTLAASVNARVARELERRCRTFSQAIERFLLDQGSAETPNEKTSDRCELGVMIAVVEKNSSNRPKRFPRAPKSE
ncbi:MAG: DUF6502 family protein [Pseudomonadota bacterium]